MIDKKIQCALSALLVLLPLSLMNGCASTSHRAPVSERSAREFAYEPDTRPATYTVRRGDTLFSIALDYGLDYKELAAWNGISNPRVLTVGRQLRLRSPVETASPRAAPPVAARSLGRWADIFSRGSEITAQSSQVAVLGTSSCKLVTAVAPR
jgi:hypothetical protein